MALTLFKTFSKEQLDQCGPLKDPEVLTTERHVYHTPFMYKNVEVGDFYEIGLDKGMEFKADTGFITIKEDKPIIAVNVVGSGCTPKGYNIVEWWDEGEDVDDMKTQLVKRQRVDNLNGTHPSIWTLMLMQKNLQGITFKNMDELCPDLKNAGIANAEDCFKKLSDGFYEGLYLGFYENTANFRIGPPNPNQMTIRSGCKVPEDPGTVLERYPGDYAIRVVETIVAK